MAAAPPLFQTSAAMLLNPISNVMKRKTPANVAEN